MECKLKCQDDLFTLQEGQKSGEQKTEDRQKIHTGKQRLPTEQPLKRKFEQL